MTTKVVGEVKRCRRARDEADAKVAQCQCVANVYLPVVTLETASLRSNIGG